MKNFLEKNYEAGSIAFLCPQGNVSVESLIKYLLSLNGLKANLFIFTVCNL